MLRVKSQSAAGCHRAAGVQIHQVSYDAPELAMLIVRPSQFVPMWIVFGGPVD
ncbi:MAG: hypothetical protein WBK08_17880 [Nitrospira sp.]